MAVELRETAPDDEWLLDRYRFEVYTDQQKHTFLDLYIRTNRHDLHPILLEALVFCKLVIGDALAEERVAEGESNIKGKGPRGKHARKSHV